jgi:PAS domain S-box-containing protein
MLSPLEHHRLIQQSLVGKLFSSFRHPAFITNAEHRIVWTKGAWETFYGYHNDEILGLPATILHDPALPEDAIKPIARQLLEKRQPWIGTYRNRHANGEIFTVFYFTVPLDHCAELPVNGVFCTCCREVDGSRLQSEVLGHVVNLSLSLAATVAADGIENSAAHLARKGQRQREIHRLTLLGYSSKEIASLMGITASTVNVVRWKLGKTTQTSPRPRSRSKRTPG